MAPLSPGSDKMLSIHSANCKLNLKLLLRGRGRSSQTEGEGSFQAGAPFEKGSFPRWAQVRGVCSLRGRETALQGSPRRQRRWRRPLWIGPAGILLDSPPPAKSGRPPLARSGRCAVGTMWPLFGSHRPGPRAGGTDAGGRRAGTRRTEECSPDAGTVPTGRAPPRAVLRGAIDGGEAKGTREK